MPRPSRTAAALPLPAPLVAPRRSLPDTVADALEREILAGRYPAGGRLPAERELATHLGINRLTLRQALARLQARGLITVLQGTGAHVADFKTTGGLDVLVALVGQLGAGRIDPRLFRDLLELRRAASVETAGLAARRRTARDVDELRAMVAAQATRLGDREAFARGDLAFCRKVIRATQNVGFELLFNTVVRLLEAYPVLAAEMYSAPEAILAVSQELVDAIAAREPRRARTLVRRALTVLDRALVARARAREHETTTNERGKRGTKR